LVQQPTIDIEEEKQSKLH